MKFEKISADEAHNMRKDVANDEGVLAKGVPVSPEVVRAPRFNEEDRSATFVMSAEVADRMGDVVVQEGIDLTNFLANPQGLLFHNSRSWPIGAWKDVQKNLSGRPKRTEGTLKLLPEGDDPDADRAAKHIKAGTMRTVSIGFRPKWDQTELIRDDDGHVTGLRFNASELLECSLVPIPALPAAAMKELSTGMLSPESLELIKGILESFELKDGSVINRGDLEAAVRRAEGEKTHFSISFKDSEASEAIRRIVREGVEAGLRQYDQRLDVQIEGAVQRADPPAPKDGEQTPVAPNPADTEKTKGMPAFLAERDPALAEIGAAVREKIATEGKADSFLLRVLKALVPTQAKAPVEEPAPEVPPAPADAERCRAAVARATALADRAKSLADAA